MKLSMILFGLVTFMQVFGVQLTALNKTKQVLLQMQPSFGSVTGECYLDDWTRIYNYSQDLGSDNTPENCRNHCSASEFAYAGVQYRTECFCGNDAPPHNRLRDATECNAECPGDDSQMCGGTWRMNIYESFPSECLYGSLLMEHFSSFLNIAECRQQCGDRHPPFPFTGFYGQSQCFCGRTAQQNDGVMALCNPNCPDGPGTCGEGVILRMNAYMSS